MNAIRASYADLPGKLEELARQMRCGDYTESSAAVLLTRCAESGFMTVCAFGTKEECDALLIEAGGTRVASLRRK